MTGYFSDQAVSRGTGIGLLLMVAAAGCASSDSARTQRGTLAGCIDSGTEVEINAALVGKGAEAVLCPGTVFTLSNPVVFTAPTNASTLKAFKPARRVVSFESAEER